MTLLYVNKAEEEDVIKDVTATTPFDRFFRRFYRFWFLIPIFPRWKEEWDKFWYKESFIMAFGFSLFFYLMALFFSYLGIADKERLMSYLFFALGWLIIGLVVPAGVYRLVIYFLKRQHLVD